MPDPFVPSPMVIGVLQFELLIHGAQSLKDKRRVVNSVKDRLHREHLVSIAEVDRLDAMGVAVLGLALVGREGKHVAEVLDRITAKLRQVPGAELGDTARQILHGASVVESGQEAGEPAETVASPVHAAAVKADGRREAGQRWAPPRAGLEGHEHDLDEEMRRRAEELDRPRD